MQQWNFYIFFRNRCLLQWFSREMFASWYLDSSHFHIRVKYVFFCKCEHFCIQNNRWQYTTIVFDKFPTKFLLQFVLFFLSRTILSHRLIVSLYSCPYWIVGSSPFRLAFNLDHLHFCICYISLAYYKIQIYLQRQKRSNSSNWDYVNIAVNTHFLEFPFSLGLWPLHWVNILFAYHADSDHSVQCENPFHSMFNNKFFSLRINVNGLTFQFVTALEKKQNRKERPSNQLQPNWKNIHVPFSRSSQYLILLRW